MLEAGGMLEGELSEINLIERFVEFWRERFTGAIRFENDGIIKIIYFKDGDVLSASTNDRADSIDEILTRAGKVTREHVRQALSRRKENETLGDALLNLGFITRKELTWARRVQVVGVIRSVDAWSAGSFTVVADYLPKRDEGTLFPLPQLLVEVIVTDQDRGRVERAMEGGDAVFVKNEQFDEEFRRLGLNEDADSIVGAVDGQRSASEVAIASGQDAFNVYKLLHAAATLGLLARVIPHAEPQVSTRGFATAAVPDAGGAWDEGSMPAEPSAPAFNFEEEDALQEPALGLQIEPLEPDSVAPAATADIEASLAGPESFESDSWDAPPGEALALPIPARIETPLAASEEWRFDQAQLETPRQPMPKASTTRPPAHRPKRRSYGLIATVLTILLLAAAAYFGYVWMQQERPSPGIAALETSGGALETSGGEVIAARGDEDAGVIEEIEPARSSDAAPQETVASAPLAAAGASDRTPAAPPVAASGDRSRADALANNYAANPEGNFTVQIQIFCDPTNVLAAGRASDNVWFVPQTIGERSCYRVFWGRYATAEEAQRAMAAIPASLRDRSAAVKPVPQVP
jgi:septal ring-binding cell division protein DamX